MSEARAKAAAALERWELELCAMVLDGQDAADAWKEKSPTGYPDQTRKNARNAVVRWMRKPHVQDFLKTVTDEAVEQIVFSRASALLGLQELAEDPSVPARERIKAFEVLLRETAGPVLVDHKHQHEVTGGFGKTEIQQIYTDVLGIEALPPAPEKSD